MATLHVRNVPESLYQRLRQHAEVQNRSLSAEVIILLNRALNETQTDQSTLLDNIRRRRSFSPTAVGAPDSTALLREDRER